VFAKIFEGIKTHCPDLAICATLSGRSFTEFELRSEVLELKPDLGSLTLGSMNFQRQASVNAPDMIIRLAQKMTALGVKPELECFDSGMVNFSKYLIEKGILSPPHYYNLLTGNLFGAQATLHETGLMIQALPANAYWSLAGLGRHQLSSHLMAFASGGGVRVGLEDNLWYDRHQSVPASNISLITRIHQLAEVCERKIMPPRVFGELGFYNQNR